MIIVKIIITLTPYMYDDAQYAIPVTYTILYIRNNTRTLNTPQFRCTHTNPKHTHTQCYERARTHVSSTKG